jgi:hypothetical protein
MANKVARATITIQNAKIDIDSFVVPDEYMRFRVIVGQDFILQNYMVIVKRRNRLILNEIPALARDIDLCDVIAKI